MNIFNVAVSLVLLLLGFLLNRVFTELDRLRVADQALVEAVNSLRVLLPQGYITQPDFHRHEAEERILMADLKAELNGRFDKVEGMIAVIHKRTDANVNPTVKRK